MTYRVQPLPINQYNTNYPYGPGTDVCMDPFACKMKVAGQGSIKAQPDLAAVIIGVTTENKQLQIAQEENARIINQVLNTLKKMGVSSNDIQTQSYRINPQYDYVEGKQIFRGYRVEHSLRITIRLINRIGEIIDAAVASGANNVSSIEFSVKDPSGYYQRALAMAIDDALAKARTLGQKLRIVVSDVPVQIVEEGFQNKSQPEPYVLQATAGDTTQIQAGQIEITAKVNAIFSYRKV